MTTSRLPGTVLAALLLFGGPLVACSSGSSGHSSTSSVTTLAGGEGEAPTSVVKKVTAPPSRHPTSPRKTSARETTAAPSPAAKVHEVDKACPYISNQNEAIAEGKAVGRSTILTTTSSTTRPAKAMPVGCKFYLAYPDYHVVTEITVKTYPTGLAAFNTVARTGGSTAESTPGIGDGAVLYRTAFYKPDGNRDWSCIFAKGKTVVTIHTDELHSSIDARNVAAAIVGKF